MQFRLISLMFVLAVGPMVLAALWFDAPVVLFVGAYVAGVMLFAAGSRYLARHGVDQPTLERSDNPGRRLTIDDEQSGDRRTAR